MTETRYSSRIPLLILLPVVAVLVVWLLPGSHHSYEESSEGGFALPVATKRVVIKLQNGNVKVVVGGPGHVRFRSRSLRVAQDEEAFKVLRAQDLTLKGELLSESGDFLLSTPPFPPGLEVDYEFRTKEGGRQKRKGLRGMREFQVLVEVPSKMPVRVDCDHGSVTIDYLNMPVEVYTGGGTVHLKVVTADTTVRNGVGDVIVDQHRGGLDIATRNGRLLVLLSEVVKPVKLRAQKGDIKCTVPPHASLDVDVKSLSGGGVVSDLGLPRGPVGQGQTGQRVQGKFNGGGPLLDAESAQGTVSVLIQR